MKTIVLGMTAVTIILLTSTAHAQEIGKNGSLMVRSADETAAKYGWSSAPAPVSNSSKKVTGTQSKHQKKSTGGHQQKNGIGVSIGGYSANHSGNNGARLISGVINLVVGDLFGGGYGLGLGGNSAETQAYIEGYERERKQIQHERERTAYEAGRNDARQGIYSPYQLSSPGERASYQRGYERERKQIQHERERTAYEAGRNVARQSSGW